MVIELHRNALSITAGAILFGIIILSACNTRLASEQIQSPRISETQSPQPPIEPSVITLPTAAGEQIPEHTDYSDQRLGEGYLAPEYIENTPVTPPGGYPSPEEEYHTPPPVKTQLEATNPSKVNLASGEVQLIEFFAFW